MLTYQMDIVYTIQTITTIKSNKIEKNNINKENIKIIIKILQNCVDNYKRQ